MEAAGSSKTRMHKFPINLKVKEVTSNRSHTVDQRKFGTILQNLWATATWRPQYVHPCSKFKVNFYRTARRDTPKEGYFQCRYTLLVTRSNILWYGLYLLTSLTPLSRVILEKLTGSQFVKKFSVFYAFTSARHLSLSWARSIHLLTVHNYSYVNHTSRMGDSRNANIILMWTHVHRGKSQQRNVSSKALTSQRAHLQDISKSTPTRDLKQHTYRRSQTAQLQETYNTPAGYLKLHAYRESACSRTCCIYRPDL
jgi:hypothetical protein